MKRARQKDAISVEISSCACSDEERGSCIEGEEHRSTRDHVESEQSHEKISFCALLCVCRDEERGSREEGEDDREQR